MKPADLLARWNAGNTEAAFKLLPRFMALWSACEAEVDAKCETSTIWKIDRDNGDACYGENHIESCPVEIARQDRIATLNALRGFR